MGRGDGYSEIKKVMDQKTHYCPEHNTALIRKRILYGYPDPSADHSKVILGGCCVSDDSPKHGFECPVDHKAFIVNSKGEVEPIFDDDEETDNGL